MTDNRQIKANCLLDALVAHFQRTLAPEQLNVWLEQELDYLLAEAGRLRLGEVVTPEQVVDTAHKYAATMELGGGMPELVGEMMERLYQSGTDSDRLIGELVDEDTITATVDKLLEVPLSRQGITWLSHNPVLLALLAGGTQLGVKTWLHQGIPEVVRGVLGRRVPERWRATAELRLQDWLMRRMEALLSDPWLYSDENLASLRELILDGWRELSERPVAELRDLLSSEDIQELFVIGYDFWRQFRHSDYFTTLLSEGVHTFFDKYRDSSLLELLEEVGIDRETMLDDARRFAPGVVRVLRDNGMLEAWLRRHLTPFFEAPETLAILGDEPPAID
ncbi:hypothetical protein B5T_04375 [Alloalcanivorax dieselolei B5]|uniref:Uncharacterized protein n=1 Tax=Alcanivorax dieselolei (strain DSM 16502 / CGMCC 1.3690 / MCCC 1A00001 / B-5) TaxID=930169 RepID=K0CJQ0_ALCDB|nr:hypothetical protein B5T_04375 [Alloalcanivorax dieselolei B5]